MGRDQIKKLIKTCNDQVDSIIELMFTEHDNIRNALATDDLKSWIDIVITDIDKFFNGILKHIMPEIFEQIIEIINNDECKTHIFTFYNEGIKLRDYINKIKGFVDNSDKEGMETFYNDFMKDEEEITILKPVKF